MAALYAAASSATEEPLVFKLIFLDVPLADGGANLGVSLHVAKEAAT
jgi:hypothetical protein